MQSETHETLYRGLADIADRIMEALGKTDARVITGLIREHHEVMDKLYRIGTSRDPVILEMAERIHRQVKESIDEIRRQRDKLSRQLGMFEKKKRVSATYNRNMAL